MSDSGQPPPPASGPGASPWGKQGCVTLRCREDGPLVVELPDGPGTGPGFRVIDHLGREFRLPTGKRAVALCRCGQTADRPFCDGSHKAARFRAADLADGP